MDDYNITSLKESNNEWISRLISILTPCIIDGCNRIYNEAYTLCLENDENDKYLMTFQNFLSRIPKWNSEIINLEVKKIKKDSACDYLEDLITCVHVIQLKALTCIRVGMNHKSIDIDIPNLDNFVHKVYINVARKLYTNVYLYEKNIQPLSVQRNKRELESIIHECILDSVRESIPVEKILRAYLDETVEETVEETFVHKASEQDTLTKKFQPPSQIVADTFDELTTTAPKYDTKNVSLPNTRLTFSNVDETQSTDNTIENVLAPKDINTLEQISNNNYAKRMLEESEEYDDDENEDETLRISDNVSNINLEVVTL